MKPRDLVEVIDRIIACIPADFERRAIVVTDLLDLQESVKYTAPEAMQRRWNQVSLALSHHLWNVYTPWELQIRDIFSGEETPPNGSENGV